MKRSRFQNAVALICATGAAIVLGACSSGGLSSDKAQIGTASQRWLQDGVISIARPAPAAQEMSADSMLAFLPVERMNGKWIRVDRSAGTVTFLDGDKEIMSAAAEGLSSLEPGRFEVLHKQRSAPWHASDEYFLRRKLPIPPQGARERFLRGALGEFALFLREDLPVHSGAVWSDDVGGVRLSESDISRLYYSVELGTAVEIR